MAEPLALNLPDTLQAVRRRLLPALLVAVPFIAGTVYYAESLPAQYDGTAVVAFAPDVDADVSGDVVRTVAPKYVVYAGARATMDRVAPRIGEDAGQLDAATQASIATDTANLKITVRLRSAPRAARAANAIAADVIQFAAADPLLAATLVAPAVPPDQPSAPPRRLIEAGGILVAVVLGSVAALLLERGRPRIRTARDVVELTAWPVIGRIPRARALRARPLAALADPAVGAAVRSLRTVLLQEMQPGESLTVGVTSGVPGEGKTTTAVSLAAAAARIDVRVVLVDGDLRRPGVARAFGIQPTPGVAQVLRGTVALVDALRPSRIVGLDILPTAADSDAGDLIPRRFGEVLGDLRTKYDVVFVDCPPLLTGDDARTLATQVDAVLLVVSAGTGTSELDEAAAVLNSLRVRVLGCVLNQTRQRTRAYGAYGD